jgi:hypothetical protein
MEKHKYLSNFDQFSLESNAFFGSLDWDYTRDYVAHGHLHM